jgi:hypothetical protein
MAVVSDGQKPIMQHASLINPFSLIAELPVVDDRTGRVARSTPVCSNCSSDDILCHATIQWSNDAQEWQLTGSFGQPAHCNNCNRSCSISWLKLN